MFLFHSESKTFAETCGSLFRTEKDQCLEDEQYFVRAGPQESATT